MPPVGHDSPCQAAERGVVWIDNMTVHWNAYLRHCKRWGTNHETAMTRAQLSFVLQEGGEETAGGSCERWQCAAMYHARH